jgi:hypothetical protein
MKALAAVLTLATAVTLPVPPCRGQAPPAGRAAAGEAGEKYTLRAAQLSDNLLRAAIGIATITVGVGGDGTQETVPVYGREGDGFRLSGSMRLDATQPVSGWVSGQDGAAPSVRRAVARRYLMVERKGSYARVALDSAGNRKEWVHKTLEWSFPDSVDFVDFGDAATWRCQQLDLFYLGGAGERRLYERAEKDAPFRALSAAPGSAHRVDGDVVPLQRQGNFFEVAAVKGLNDPKTSIGWVELKDGTGRLQVWFSPGPDC